MNFVSELERVLPDDLPNRQRVRDMCARHLDLIVAMNEHLNLTRITTPEEAAIKHVLDSVLPWRHFYGVDTVLDAGTGAGLPGIPLALVLPDTRFMLVESIGKKARFVQAAVDELRLPNVTVQSHRAEEVLRTAHPSVITARAIAPLARTMDFFATALNRGSRALLYKGPDVEKDIDEAQTTAKKFRVTARIVDRYELPLGLGSRTLVEVKST